MTGKPNLSSIDLCRATFREVVVLAAESAPGSGLQFAPMPIDGSYFIAPRRPRLTREQMESVERIGEIVALEQLWRDCEYSALLALIPRLKIIAECIAAERSPSENEPKNPSHLIYQMY